MTDTVDRILMRYQSQDFSKVIAEQKTLASQYDKTAKAEDKVTTSGGKLEQRLGKLQSLGRNLRQAGGFLGNDTIRAAGDLADGLSDVGDSINMISKGGGKLGKILGGITAAVGGASVGASIYDATIGKAQGTNTQTILYQLGELFRTGFNVETLRVEAQTAYMNAQIAEASKFKYEPSGLSPDITTPLRSRGLGGDFSMQALQKELLNQQELLKTRLTEGDVIGSTVAMVQSDIDKLKAAIDALKQITPIDKSWQGAFGNIQRGASAGMNLLQAGQTFQNRQAGARNVYASALYAIEQETGQKRAEIARNYSQSLIALDNEYYANRQKLAEEYGAETAKLEADHQKDIRRMQEDHQGRLKKLVESRDALAVEDEIEQYNKERQRSEEDYQEMMQSRQQDYAAQLRELERAHDEQRRERQAAYQEQLRDLALQAQQRRQQEAVQYNLLLRDILQAFVNARNEFASAVTTNNSTVTNNNQSPTVNINGANQNLNDIQSAVYGAIVGAFG